jgi:pSer/pThr/pTyr-binding forkhead associated (FHA) protein
MALLIVEKGNSQDVGRKITLGENTILIGRVTPESCPDLPLQDDFVSRKHAEIVFHQNCFKLRDLESTNGTLLDNIRVEPGKMYPLKHDSLIGLGIESGGARVIIRFEESLTLSTVRIDLPQKQIINDLAWININKQTEEVWVDEKRLTLTRLEYKLILFLYNNAGKLCHRDELIAGVWPEVENSGGVSDAAIDQLVHRIRIKIELDPSDPEHIISRKGYGIILV